MNVNKKLDRLRQWGKEKMGAEVKTASTEDFKALEAEMNMRSEGLDKMHASMSTYVKSLNKRTEGDAKERNTPVGGLGASMTRHGEMFEEGNKFGECLVGFGQANERIARMQETYASDAASSWLDALERSIAQMKDYQNARRKLESRRLAYDTSMVKIQKARKEDFRAEEELRSQKAKYEESAEDVYRRMQDIVDSEQESTAELCTFLEAQLNFHDRCREILLQAKQEWPMSHPTSQANMSRRPNPPPSGNRMRSFTASSAQSIEEDEEADSESSMPSRPFRNGNRAPSSSFSQRLPTQYSAYDTPCNTSSQRAVSADPPSNRVPTPLSYGIGVDASATRTPLQLRPVANRAPSGYESSASNSPEQYWDSETTRSSSPATSASVGSAPMSRNGSWSTLGSASATSKPAFPSQAPAPLTGTTTATGKKIPPPPPPSRGTKPPPPPPPMKRSALSASSVPSAV